MWGSSIRHNLHPFGTYSHTNKNETASLSINLRLRIIPLMFQMPNSFIIGFKNMNVSMIGFQYICDVKEFYSLVSKIFCHFCWSANNFQVGQGHWRNLWLTLPTKQKKNTFTESYFQQDNFFSQGIYNLKALLHFCEKRIEHFGNHTSSLILYKLSSELKSVWHPKWKKN